MNGLGNGAMSRGCLERPASPHGAMSNSEKPPVYGARGVAGQMTDEKQPVVLVDRQRVRLVRQRNVGRRRSDGSGLATDASPDSALMTRCSSSHDAKSPGDVGIVRRPTHFRIGGVVRRPGTVTSTNVSDVSPRTPSSRRSSGGKEPSWGTAP